MRSRFVSRTFGLAAVSLALVACYPKQFDIGDATTAVELAPSLEALREAAPEHHRRLVDGTFDSLSLLEQWDFVAELRELAMERHEVARAEYRADRKRLYAEILDWVDTMPPEEAEEMLGGGREHMLQKLKSESDVLRVENWIPGFARQVFPEDALQ